MTPFRFTLTLVASGLTALPLLAQSLTIPTVVVGDPGNPSDPSSGLGSVAYEYRIGTYEVTNAQYATFLNAVAVSDDFNLYSTSMSSDARGGINRAGSPGTYTYSVKAGYENMPVVFVSYWDAARFSNWLGTGFTEGRDPMNPSVLLPGAAYDTNFVASPVNAAGTRLTGAAVFLPSQNEWHKAAFFHPQSAGGPSDNYWLYATRSDMQPTSRTPAAFPNSANYRFDDGVANEINGGYAVTQNNSFDATQNYLTNVGVYGPDSQSYYGTADQNGNVWEWDESRPFSSSRALRGGSWDFSRSGMQSSFPPVSFDPSVDGNSIGFRVASLAAIPEPGTYAALAGAAALAALLWRRRARSGL